jgi:phosphoglycolate phosphatase
MPGYYFPGLRANNPELRKTLEDYEIEALESMGGEFYNGVIEGIQSLAGETKIFLVSNCKVWYLDIFLQLSGLKPVLSGFDCNGISGQPKNEMLLNMKIKHSLPKPLYIGDTAGDETAAKLAGIEFVHAAWGFGKPERDAIAVNSFLELLDYLRG